MRHGGVVDIDEVILAEIPELMTRERSPKVGDDSVGYSKAVCDLFEECWRSIRHVFTTNILSILDLTYASQH